MDPEKPGGSGAWPTYLVDGAPAIPFTNRGRILNTTVNLSLPLFEQNALTLAYICSLIRRSIYTTVRKYTHRLQK